MVASVPFAEQSQERWRRFTAVLRAEFGKAADDWPATMSYGPEVDMKILPDGGGTKENFQFQVDYVASRTAVLGWLESFKRWSGTRSEDDDHIVFRSARGAEISLSKRTGFIDSIRKQKENGVSSIDLESLDLDPKLDDHSFDLPKRSPEASDGSAQISATMEQVSTLALRKELFSWISLHVSDGKIGWNADARAHVRAALAALHSDGITLEREPWISDTRKWIESTGGWLREHYAALAKSDDATRGELEARARGFRDKLFDSLQRILKARVSGLEIRAAFVPDATLRSSLLELEQASVEVAFEHSLQNPLLEAFDAQVERAKSGG
jgi:hypothetical protein